MAGGEGIDDVFSPDESPIPVIVGAVVAVIFIMVFLALAVAAIICCKIRVLRKYNIETHSRDNGELTVQGESAL